MEMIRVEDLNVIKEMAKRYDMSAEQFGKLIVSQTKARKERQFRVSEAEDEIILAKANKKGMTKMHYCEYACGKFLKNEKLGEEFFFQGNRYGENRTRRITVIFKDEDVERKLLNVAVKFGMDVGTLIRYCALNY